MVVELVLRVVRAGRGASSGAAVGCGAFGVGDRAVGRVAGSGAPGCGGCACFDAPSCLRCWKEHPCSLRVFFNMKNA